MIENIARVRFCDVCWEEDLEHDRCGSCGDWIRAGVPSRVSHVRVEVLEAIVEEVCDRLGMDPQTLPAFYLDARREIGGILSARLTEDDFFTVAGINAHLKAQRVEADAEPEPEPAEAPEPEPEAVKP